MDTTITILLAVIGVMLVYVVYLQIRLFIASRSTFVVVPPVVSPPATDENSGCGLPLLGILFILAVLALAAIFGFLPIG